MQYTGTVAMFNSQLRRDRLGGLQEEQRPANNMIQYDLPQKKKSQGQSRRTHEPKRTSPSHHGRVCVRTERWTRWSLVVAGFREMHYYYYYYVHAPW